MDNALTLLGLMKKAGALEIGAENAYGAVLEKKARLLITASDASPHVLRQMERAACETGVKYLNLKSTKAETGAALGQKECAAAALTDTGFARAFCEKLGQTQLSDFFSGKEKKAKAKRQAARGKSKGETANGNKI